MIRTLLTLRRFDRNSKLVEVRKGYSRSFTRNFINGLYVSHGHILTASALNFTDVMGSTTRLVDGDSNQGTANQILDKSNMRIAGPCGNGAVALFTGESTPGPVSVNGIKFPGHAFGIQIGSDATVVTPTDSRLIERIGHGVNPSVAPAAVIDQVIAGDTGDDILNTTNSYLGMIYTPLRSFTLTDVQFKVWRTGAAPGNVSVKIIGLYHGGTVRVWADTTIIGSSDLVDANAWGAASPGAFVSFPFSTPVQLHAGFVYLIAIYPSQAAAANYVNWRTVAGAYARKTNANFANLGVEANLGDYNIQFPLFIFTGTAQAEMEYGGTDIYGYSVVNPNASFTMRRIFMNNSGEAITVREAGIYFPLTNYKNLTLSPNYNAFIACAARDVIAPAIAVAHGESLEVTYTPSITV